jgi:DNA-binding Lrp family transcriptional regulator
MVQAFVMIQIKAGEYLGWLESIMEKMASIKGVTDVYSIFGRFDLVVQVEASDVNTLNSIVNDYIRTVPGVLRTETFMITRSLRHSG